MSYSLSMRNTVDCKISLNYQAQIFWVLFMKKTVYTKIKFNLLDTNNLCLFPTIFFFYLLNFFKNDTDSCSLGVLAVHLGHSQLSYFSNVQEIQDIELMSAPICHSLVYKIIAHKRGYVYIQQTLAKPGALGFVILFECQYSKRV